MRGRSLRAVRTFAVTTAVIAVLGPVAGVVWHLVAPTVGFVVVRGQPYFADGETQAPIGTDARFALIGIVAGLVCGVVAYKFGGRDNDVPLLAGLAVGGTAATLLAWWVGHQFGLSHYQHVLHTGADGAEVNGPPDVRARGVLVFWPLFAVGTYAAMEVLFKRLLSGDSGEETADGSGERAADGAGVASSGGEGHPETGGDRPAAAANGDRPASEDNGDRPASEGGQAKPDRVEDGAPASEGDGGDGKADGGKADGDGDGRPGGSKGVRPGTTN